MGSSISAAAYKEAEETRLNAVKTVALLKSIELAAIALLNADDLIDNYKKQRDIQDRSLALAEEAQAQLSGTFWPRELQFLAEFANPEDIEPVEVMGRRYGGRLVSTIAGAFALKIKEAKCSMPRHCTSANMKTLQDLYAARAFAIAAARALGRNIAFAEYQARDDKNWDKRAQAVALGRKLMGEAANLMKSALGGLAVDASGLSQSVSSALQGIGYEVNRVNGFQADTNVNIVQDQVGPPTQAEVAQRGDTFATRMSQYLEQDAASATALPGSNITTNLAGAGDSLTSLAAERMNDSSVGPKDLVRTGKKRFPLSIGFGSVLVDMDQFNVGFAEHMDAGDSGAAKDGY